MGNNLRAGEKQTSLYRFAVALDSSGLSELTHRHGRRMAKVDIVPESSQGMLLNVVARK